MRKTGKPWTSDLSVGNTKIRGHRAGSVYAARRQKGKESMNQTDRTSIGSKKAAAIVLAVIVYVILTGGWASAQQGSGLSAVGGVDPAIGYTKWYMDGSGLQLAPCLDTTAGDPWLLAGTFPNPGAAISFPGNFPERRSPRMRSFSLASGPKESAGPGFRFRATFLTNSCTGSR